MARQPRIHFEGAFFHVTHRGNNREDLFFDRRDRVRYLELVIEGIARFAFTIHALCLMTNHVHLLIEVGATPLAEIMHNLSFRFASWLNHTQNRSGHVFQGRYDSRLIDCDDYLLAALRYIHRNPVEGGLVRDAADYEWSSHRTYLGHPQMRWVATRRLLGLLGRTPRDALVAYRQLIDGEDDAGIVTDGFFGDAEDIHPLSVEIVLDAVARDCGISVRDLALGKSRGASEGRALVSHVCRELRVCRLAALARVFRRDDSALRHAIRTVVARSRNDPQLRRRIDRLMRRLAGI